MGRGASVGPTWEKESSRQTAARTEPAKGSVSETVVRMETQGDVLAAIRELVEQAKSRELPAVLSFEDAAKQLSISVPTLKRMVREAEIFAVPIFKRMGIPRGEIERISRGEPSPKTLKASLNAPRSPRARKVAAKSARDEIRELAKKYR